MDKPDKKIFVYELIGSVVDDVMTAIDEGKIPEEWDGHELRKFLADKFAGQVADAMKSTRLREYKNTVIVNNL
jgi:hypothetical protein